MKRLLLFLITFISLNAVAQNSSIIFERKDPKYGYKPHPAINLQQTPLQRKLENGTGYKTTDGVTGEWFSAQDAGTELGVTKEWLYPIMPDSIYYVNDSIQPFFWYIMGIGTSLDPTSSRFNEMFVNLYSTPPCFHIPDSKPYIVDSILVVGRYDRIHSHTDTLYIDVTIADTTSQTFKLTYGPDPFYLDSLGGIDSFFHCAFANYDWTNNRISDSVAPIRRIMKILDAAAALDTLDGLNQWTLALDPPLAAAAGSKVVAQVTFASGYDYPFQTDLDSANKWNAYTLELNGDSTFPYQIHNDYASGLIIETRERYHLDGYHNHQGTAIQVPTYIYPSSVGFDDPYFGFFIRCPSCLPCGNIYVHELTNSLTEPKAYPNPANDETNIVFSVANHCKATIMLTNTIGQLIHNKTVNTKANEKTIVPFSTTNLTNGIYFFTVEANGQQKVGRFVVAH